VHRAGTETISVGLIIHRLIVHFLYACPKIVKIGWKKTKLWQY